MLLIVESIGYENIHKLLMEHVGVNFACWSQIRMLWEIHGLLVEPSVCFIHF